MKTLIVVPARYGSTRFPGKPLVEIAGRTMVSRVAAMASRAAAELDDAASVVATDDERIASHCRDLGIEVVMTDPNVPSGTDRALAAVDAMGVTPNVVVNLQGDSPFTPPAHVVGVTDTGIGIPAEDLPRLATPFEQVSGTKDRNYEGTGLGLALTKSFAEMHGGRMILSSIEGEGTTVAFTLPISGARELVDETNARDVA